MQAALQSSKQHKSLLNSRKAIWKRCSQLNGSTFFYTYKNTQTASRTSMRCQFILWLFQFISIFIEFIRCCASHTNSQAKNLNTVCTIRTVSKLSVLTYSPFAWSPAQNVSNFNYWPGEIRILTSSMMHILAIIIKTAFVMLHWLNWLIYRSVGRSNQW